MLAKVYIRQKGVALRLWSHWGGKPGAQVLKIFSGFMFFFAISKLWVFDGWVKSSDVSGSTCERSNEGTPFSSHTEPHAGNRMRSGLKLLLFYRGQADEEDLKLDSTPSAIEQLLTEVILLQNDHVAKVCSVCEAPCCSRVHYLFDEKDLVFVRTFLGKELPRRRSRSKKGCLFLSPEGCSLEPKARPFTCHRYLCSKLKDEIACAKPELLDVLKEKFRRLEDLRARLWREYIDDPGSNRETRARKKQCS
jgi:hypothetical protein